MDHHKNEETIELEPYPPLRPLNPGTSTKRAPRSCWTCLFYTAVVFGTLGVLAFLSIVALGIWRAIPNHRNPHQALLQNDTSSLDLAALITRTVGPLVDREQKFDIAVSVWIRATEEEEKAAGLLKAAANTSEENTSPIAKRQNDELVPLRGDSGLVHGQEIEAGTKNIYIASSSFDFDFNKPDEDVLETVLFSDIVFRGVKLTDKNIAQQVKFRLPTARFLGTNLTGMDLRGSFVLIPSSPSPLDRLKNFTSWYPESIKLYPVRSWPFPLGSTDAREKTLAEKAVDSFGFSVPLIQFHAVPKRCPSDSTDETLLSDSALPSATPTIRNDFDDFDDENEDTTIITSSKASAPSSSTAIHKRHPFIVTRTQIRVVDETRRFNKKKYNNAYKDLAAKACSFPSSKKPRSRRFCNRSYNTNGHWETRLLLETEKTSENPNIPDTEMAYPPYMDSLSNAAGPMDIFPVPVSRENCTIPANDTTSEVKLPKQDEEYMDITWKISFSGRSPAKFNWGDTILMFSQTSSYNESEAQRVQDHDRAALYNGIVGHRFDPDMHPRRRFVIGTIIGVISFALIILDVHYWYTRVSTVSISIPGSALIVTGTLLAHLAEGIPNLFETTKDHGDSKMVMMLLALPVIFVFLLLNLPTFVMIKAILRLEWSDSGWFRLRRARATHRERASERLDAQISWKVYAGILFALWGFAYIFPDGVIFIQERNTVPTPTASNIKQWMKYLNPFIWPLYITGSIMQTVLNHRSRTFAGRHRIAAIFLALEILLLLISQGFIPGVVGRLEFNDSLGTHTLIRLVDRGVMVWQALTLPPVSQKVVGGVDEDEE